MTGFLSALGGFAKGLDQSLQRNEAYVQQAAAEEKRASGFVQQAGDSADQQGDVAVARKAMVAILNQQRLHIG